jgi:hypothetical protein
LSIVGELVGENFDRDPAIETRVVRRIDPAHPAGPEWSEDFVRTETCAGNQGQCLRV